MTPARAVGRKARGDVYRPLSEPDFRTFWLGGLASNVGTWLQNVAASVYMMTLTGSSLWVGYLNFATFAPVFLFGMLGGVLSDRFRRRRIITVTHVFAAVVSSGLAAATFLDVTTPLLLMAAAFTLGSSYSLAKPTLSALLPALVPEEHLTRATAVNTLQFNLGQLLGSALATALLIAADPAWAFALNALTFLGPVIAMRRIRITPRTAAQRATQAGLRALGAGIAFVARHRVMSATLLAVVLANVAVEALRTLAPGFATDVLGVDESAAGYIVTAFSLGATGGLLVFTWLSARLPEMPLMMVGFALQAVGIGAVAASSSVGFAVVGAVPIGVGFTFLIPGLNAGLLKDAPPAYRGRVMSAYAMAHLGLRPVSGLAAGALAAVVGERMALAVFVGGAVLGLAALRGVAVSRRA